MNITSTILEVQQHVRSLIDLDITLAPKFLRLAFHDAVSLNCLNIDDPENLGLGYPISALDPIVQNYTQTNKLSKSDIWVAAALVACEVTSGGYEFPMYYYGRGGASAGSGSVLGTDESSSGDGCKDVITRPFPSADLTTHTLLKYFSDHFNFNPRETVVVMGAHTIGQMARNHSGFSDGSSWVDERHVLNNEYYKTLVGGRPNASLKVMVDNGKFWTRHYLSNVGVIQSIVGGRIPNRFMWTRRSSATEEGGNNNVPLVMTNADIALVRDLEEELDADGSGRVRCDFAETETSASSTGDCPAAEATIYLMSEFKHNNTLWLIEFEQVLRKMFMYGYSVSHSDGDVTDGSSSDVDPGCADIAKKCLKLVNPNIIPPPTNAPTFSSPTQIPTSAITSMHSTSPTISSTIRPTATPLPHRDKSPPSSSELFMPESIILIFCVVIGLVTISCCVFILCRKRRIDRHDAIAADAAKTGTTLQSSCSAFVDNTA